MCLFKEKNVKIIVLTCVLLCAVSASSFAVDDFGLESKLVIIVKFLSSPWVKAIAFAALVIECVAMITAGRQEPGMFKKFIPWIIGTIVFMAAPAITNKFLITDPDKTLQELGFSDK